MKGYDHNFEYMPSKLIGLLIVIGFGFLYWYFQPIIQLDNGHPWDANNYYVMAQQVVMQQPLSGEKPFIYRLGTSFLVGKLFPANLMLGFTLINALFGIGIIVSTAIILSRLLKTNWIVLVLLGLLVMNPNGPARFLGLFPVFTDPSALFFIATIFAIGGGKETNIVIKLALVLLSMLGVFFREIVLIAPLSLLIENVYWRYFVKQYNKNAMTYCLVLSVILGAISLVVTHLMVVATGDYTSASHALISLKRHIAHPDIFIVAFLTTYGPVFLILVLNVRDTVKIIAQYPHLFCYLVMVLILAILGGTHTDRFIFWAFPVILLALGFIIKNSLLRAPFNFSTAWFWLILVGSQLVAFRAFAVLPGATFNALKDWWVESSLMPNSIFFAPYGDGLHIIEMYSSFMNIKQRMIVLTQYVYLLLVLSFLMPKAAK